jgi:hypothetical protein
MCPELAYNVAHDTHWPSDTPALGARASIHPTSLPSIRKTVADTSLASASKTTVSRVVRQTRRSCCRVVAALTGLRLSVVNRRTPTGSFLHHACTSSILGAYHVSACLPLLNGLQSFARLSFVVLPTAMDKPITVTCRMNMASALAQGFRRRGSSFPAASQCASPPNSPNQFCGQSDQQPIDQ